MHLPTLLSAAFPQRIRVVGPGLKMMPCTPEAQAVYMGML